jgi:TPR repeat protein
MRDLIGVAFLTLLVSMVRVAPVVAGPLEDATAADSRGDYAVAIRLLDPLAAQGNARAQDALGSMYERGNGVPRDDAQAVKWVRKAADQGNAAAQFSLGREYDEGRGVAQDSVRAYMWYNLAAAGFNADQTEERDQAVARRDEVAGNMTTDQIAEAQRLAQAWKSTRQAN